MAIKNIQIDLTVGLDIFPPPPGQPPCICCPGLSGHVSGQHLVLPSGASGALDLTWAIHDALGTKRLNGRRLRMTVELLPAEPAPEIAP